MIYPELFKQLEAVRWNMDKDIPWDQFDASKLTEEQAQTIKMNAITEWAALPATEMFLRDNKNDADFCGFMSVWFFEEQKHSLVLMEYLRKFRPELVPTEAEARTALTDLQRGQSFEDVARRMATGDAGVSLSAPAANAAMFSSSASSSATWLFAGMLKLASAYFFCWSVSVSHLRNATEASAFGEVPTTKTVDPTPPGM